MKRVKRIKAWAYYNRGKIASCYGENPSLCIHLENPGEDGFVEVLITPLPKRKRK